MSTTYKEQSKQEDTYEQGYREGHREARAICPACLEFTINYITLTDDEHDEIIEIGEYCEDENCGYSNLY